MNQLRIRPKSDFMHTASYSQLHALTRYWRSDMAFYKDELRFLANLLDKYFIWLQDEALTQKALEIKYEIQNNTKEAMQLEDKIRKHLTNLELLVENPFSHDEQIFRSEHEELEDDMAEFSKAFRRTKKEVFLITEKVMLDENMQEYLS